jgi:hypothetical protein
MNKKVLVLSLVVFSVLPFFSLVNAQELQPVTAWTDKSKYALGEKGMLYVAFYNDKDTAVEIRNVTIVYTNWNAYIDGRWVGNETRTLSIPLSSKAVYVFSDLTFTVPVDGRGISTGVSIKIGTDYGYKTGYAYVNVLETPRYMEQIITLFTILLVLTIVCTIIVAATIFLSGRRPQVIWRKEEKVE